MKHLIYLLTALLLAPLAALHAQKAPLWVLPEVDFSVKHVNGGERRLSDHPFLTIMVAGASIAVTAV